MLCSVYTTFLIQSQYQYVQRRKLFRGGGVLTALAAALVSSSLLGSTGGCRCSRFWWFFSSTPLVPLPVFEGGVAAYGRNSRRISHGAGDEGDLFEKVLPHSNLAFALLENRRLFQRNSRRVAARTLPPAATIAMFAAEVDCVAHNASVQNDRLENIGPNYSLPPATPKHSSQTISANQEKICSCRRPAA